MVSCFHSFTLQCLCFEDKDRILWVEYICVSHNDLQERFHQHLNTEYLFSHAERIVVWLGPATDETNILVDSLKQLQIESIKYGTGTWDLADKDQVELWSAVQSR